MDYIRDPSLVLCLPLHELDGASIISKDKCGHLCTVTGALWRPEGHYFDGVDDYIDLSNLSYSGTTHSWELWLNSYSSTAVGKYVFDIQTGRVIFAWGHDTQATKCGLYDGSWRIIADAPSAQIWHHICITFAPNNTKMYLDGVEYASTAIWGARAIGGTIRLGGRYSGTQYQWRGSIGEVRVYTRRLALQEIQHNYLATKWRYR